jgi:predicted ArsR family transcriptional regulator
MSALRPTSPTAGSGVREGILEALRCLPVTARRGEPTRAVGLSAPELARRLGVHVTTVRFHLGQLRAAAQVAPGLTAAAPGRRGRPPTTYAATAGAVAGADDDRAYRMFAELLADSCCVDGTRSLPPTPEEVGRQWAERHTLSSVSDPVSEGSAPSTSPGRWMGKVGQFVEFLSTWGYHPDVRFVDGGRTADIELSHCPFQELARTRQDVVCGIHRGLISGAMEALGEASVGVSLEPFATPDLCRVHLTSTTLDEGTAR